MLEACVGAVRRTLDRILTELADRPGRALRRGWSARQKKRVLSIDVLAERVGRDYLLRRFPELVDLRGEESSLEPVGTGRFAVLMDMVDGSDLLERGLGNWCSALVAFDRRQDRIICAVVGLPSGTIYYARHSKPGAFTISPIAGKGRVVTRIKSPSRRVPLTEASICFYGQTAGALLSMTRGRRGLARLLKEVAAGAANGRAARGEPGFRIYNLGGNPMMLKVAEGVIDVVLGVNGHYCHDVVPGAFIAMKAGAVLKDLRGKTISERDLARRLRDPSQKIDYILCRNPQIARELRKRFP